MLKSILQVFLSIVILAAFLAGVFSFSRTPGAENFREGLKLQWDKFLYFINLSRKNMEVEMNPQRKRPRNLYARQDRLMMTFGEPFRNFSKKEWEEFWDVVFGVVVETGPQGENIKRQRTHDEVESYLRYNYSRWTANYTADHWREFWNIIYTKRSW